jgi:large repetitive protein
MPGQPLTYTLSYRNDNVGLAENARLTLTLPAQLTNVQVTGGTPAGAGVWQLGDIGPGASGAVTVTATIDATLAADTDLAIAAEIGGDQPDTDGANNRVETSLRVVVPRVSFASATLSAGEGDGTVNVGVILDRANPYGPTLVDLAAGAGQAQSGSDFTLATGSLSVPAGATSAGLALTIVDDAIAEPAESVALTLANPQGAALGAPSSATLSIADNDSPATPAETYELHLPFVAR